MAGGEPQITQIAQTGNGTPCGRESRGGEEARRRGGNGRGGTADCADDADWVGRMGTGCAFPCTSTARPPRHVDPSGEAKQAQASAECVACPRAANGGGRIPLHVVLLCRAGARFLLPESRAHLGLPRGPCGGDRR